jgi:hypothetical protein
MKLIQESIQNVEFISESVGDKKEYYLTGIFMQSEIKNRNGRIYPKSVLKEAVKAYQDKINGKIAVGELNHPDRPNVDLTEACMLIESLEWEGNNIVGKAKVLDTPKGKIVKALIDGGVKLGVSSRGMGAVKSMNEGTLVESFVLTAIDVVDTPSAPLAQVDSLYESAEWILVEGEWTKQEKKAQLNESELLEKIDSFLSQI